MSLLSSERKKKHREVYTGRFTFSLTHRNVQVNQWYKKRPFIAWWPPSLLKRGKDLASCRRSFGVAFFRGSRERELKLFFFLIEWTIFCRSFLFEHHPSLQHMGHVYPIDGHIVCIRSQCARHTLGLRERIASGQLLWLLDSFVNK